MWLYSRYPAFGIYAQHPRFPSQSREINAHRDLCSARRELRGHDVGAFLADISRLPAPHFARAVFTAPLENDSRMKGVSHCHSEIHFCIVRDRTGDSRRSRRTPRSELRCHGWSRGNVNYSARVRRTSGAMFCLDWSFRFPRETPIQGLPFAVMNLAGTSPYPS